MQEYGFWSLIPPILAIGLAIRTRQVVFSLTIGIFVGYLVISGGSPIGGFFKTVEGATNVFQSKGNTRTIMLTLLIGSLIQLIKYSGGINGFVNWVQKKFERESNVEGKIQASAALVGFLVFVESNISILTVGTIFRSLFDKYKISREKLAYIADSSSAPSCILFPLNAWGAYIMGLLVSYEHLDPFMTLVYAIPFNFYAILTLIFVFWLALSRKDFFTMKKVQERINSKHTKKWETTSYDSSEKTTPAYNMILPILVMVISMPIFLIHSGWDTELANEAFFTKIWKSISNGSGSLSVLNACVLSIIFTAILFAFQRLVSLKSFIEESLKGMSEMMVMALLMVLAFALGDLCKELGTGLYVAEVTQSWLKPELAPALIFLISGFIAFSTGTSWGTFAIMISIAIPLSTSIHANDYLMLAAVLGGGVFGDHCSPISDTTLIASVASVASECNHIDHVKTQLPYALFTGGVSVICYLVAGFIF